VAAATLHTTLRLLSNSLDWGQPASYAAGGLSGALGLFAVDRQHSATLVSVSLIPIVLRMLEHQDVEVRVHAAAIAGLLLWHPRQVGSYEPPATVVVGAGSAMQGQFRAPFAAARGLRAVLQAMGDSDAAELAAAALHKATAVAGVKNLDEAAVQEVYERCARATILLRQCSAAAVMALAAEGGEHVTQGVVATFLRRCYESMDAPSVLHHMAAAAW